MPRKDGRPAGFITPYRRNGEVVEGRWRIVIDLGRDEVSGRRIRPAYYFTGTEEEANEELTRLRDKAADDELAVPSARTVGKWMDEWLAIKAGTQTVTRSTLRGYSGVIERYIRPELGDVRLSSLKGARVQSFYSKLLAAKPAGYGVSANTAHHVHVVLHQALAKAASPAYRYIRVNPLEKGRGVEPPHQQPYRDKTALTVDEVQMLLAASENSGTPRFRRLYVPIMLAVTTGLRRGELLALRWNDVDLEKKTLTVRRVWEKDDEGAYHIRDYPKSEHSERTITLPDVTVAALGAEKVDQEQRRAYLKSVGDEKTYRDDYGRLVVCWEDGTPWWPDSFSSAYRDFARQAGIRKHRFHDLRRSCGSLHLLAGTDLKVISEILGHGSVAFTAREYVDVMQKLQEDAAQRMDGLMAPVVSNGGDKGGRKGTDTAAS